MGLDMIGWGEKETETANVQARMVMKILYLRI
jgi:hypothetical protein